MAAAAKGTECFGAVSCGSKRAHESSIEGFSEIVAFETPAVDLDRSVPIVLMLETLAKPGEGAHESRPQGVPWLGEPGTLVIA